MIKYDCRWLKFILLSKAVKDGLPLSLKMSLMLLRFAMLSLIMSYCLSLMLLKMSLLITLMKIINNYNDNS